MTRAKITTRERLIAELTHAAELEHAVICQYLYAAHSLKSHPAEDGVTDALLERVREWQAAILLVARGEMEHLGLVCNLISAVGGVPAFRRRGFPHEGPGACRFSLDPFSEDVMERFIGLEASHDDGAVQDLYAAIRAGFETLANGDTPLFVGNDDAQVSNRSIGLPRGWYDIDMTPVTDLNSALAAIDRILEAGESGQSAHPPTHRARFEATLADVRAARSAHGEFDPVRPVASNPSTRTPAADGCTPIDHPITRYTAALFNSAYETMLIMLTRFYTPTDETEEERSFLGKIAFRPLMTVVTRPLAEILTHMPVSDALPGYTAGPAFEMEGDLALPRDKADAWPLLRERLHHLSHRARQLDEMMARETSPWATPLVPRASFLAENLEALAVSFSHHMEKAAATAAFKKLMES